MWNPKFVHHPQGWAIAHSLNAHFPSFQKCNCGIALFLFVALLKSAIVRSHFSWKCDCAIALFDSLFRSLIVRSHFLLHFSKVWSHNRSFKKVGSHDRSFEKSECAKMCKKVWISKLLFFRTLKRALHNRTFEKSELEKMCKKAWISESHFFCSLKRAIPHYQNGQLPSPACWAICTFGNSHLFCHFCTFALFKSAIVQLNF